MFYRHDETSYRASESVWHQSVLLFSPADAWRADQQRTRPSPDKRQWGVLTPPSAGPAITYLPSREAKNEVIYE